jgi:hypothetical protein
MDFVTHFVCIYEFFCIWLAFYLYFFIFVKIYLLYRGIHYGNFEQTYIVHCLDLPHLMILSWYWLTSFLWWKFWLISTYFLFPLFHILITFKAWEGNHLLLRFTFTNPFTTSIFQPAFFHRGTMLYWFIHS